MNINDLNQNPFYVSGAFFSQANNLSFKGERATLQDTCFIATVASFIKKQDATCYASSNTLLNAFNRHAKKFGIPEIKRSTFFAIQSRVLKSGLVMNLLSHDVERAKNWRKFTLNTERLVSIYQSVYNLAMKRIDAFKTRSLDSCGSQENTTKESSNDAGSSKIKKSQNWTRITKESKDLENKNKTPDCVFFKSRFKEDCDLAYQLQNQARAGKILASGAKKLIQLHNKHQVPLGPTFEAYLKFVLYSSAQAAQDAPETAPQASPAELSHQKHLKMVAAEEAAEAAQGPKEDSQVIKSRGLSVISEIKGKLFKSKAGR